MFESSPSLYFLESFCSCGLVSLNGFQRWTESGRKPERDGSSGQSDAFGDLDRGAPQHLGVELVGAALDLAGDLVEERDQHVAVDLDAVALGLLGERLVDPGLPVDQRAVDVERDECDVLRDRHRRGIMPCEAAARPRAVALAPFR